MSEEAFKTAKCKLESHSGGMISDDTSGDKVIGDGWAGFATPFTGVTKRRVEDCDLGSVVGKKQRVK